MEPSILSGRKYIGLLLLVAVLLSSCASAKRDEKFYERQEKKQAKMEQKEYDKKVKVHKQLQSRETLKMMKKAEKESKKLNKPKRR